MIADWYSHTKGFDMSTKSTLTDHPAAFNPNDPNQWITLTTGIMQIAMMIFAVWAQANNPPKPSQ